MSISWKVLAAAAAVTAVLSGCSSVSLDEGNKAGTLAGERTGAARASSPPLKPLPSIPSWIRLIRFTTARFISRLTPTKFLRSMPLWLKPTPSGLLPIRR